MADIYDFFLALDLGDTLSDAEVAELRWHLGLGPRPGELSIVTDFSDLFHVVDDDGEDVLDGDGEPVMETSPVPLLAQRGPALKTGGAVFSVLERREGKGWSLTTRQELHPDDYQDVDVLLEWLAARADYAYQDTDGTTKSGGFGNFIGYERFHEETTGSTLLIKDFKIIKHA